MANNVAVFSIDADENGWHSGTEDGSWMKLNVVSRLPCVSTIGKDE
jgi:hypothetical protein